MFKLFKCFSMSSGYGFSDNPSSEVEVSRILVFEGVACLSDEVAGVEEEGVVDLVAVALELLGGEVSEIAFLASDNEVFVGLDLAVVDGLLPQG